MTDSDWEDLPTLLDRIGDIVRTAEDLALPPTDRQSAARIHDDLVPVLYEARTYVETGQPGAPAVRLNISSAMLVASDLTDADPRFAPLFSRLRVLREEVGLAAR